MDGRDAVEAELRTGGGVSSGDESAARERVEEAVAVAVSVEER